MAKSIIFNKSLIGVFIAIFATTLFAQKPRNISGTLVDEDGNAIVKNTVLLLAEDGTESQRTETSKKRLGRGGGKFEFKKVEPGNYTVEADGGDAGKTSMAVEVSDSHVKLGDVVLSATSAPEPADANTSQTTAPEAIPIPSADGSPSVEFKP